MVRNDPKIMRASFGAVIAAVLFGWWFASTFWQFDLASTLQSTSPEGNADLVDVMASIADQMLLLFLDLASPDG